MYLEQPIISSAPQNFVFSQQVSFDATTTHSTPSLFKSQKRQANIKQFFVITIIMDNSSYELDLNEMSPQVSRVLNYLHQLAAQPAWRQDFEDATFIPSTSDQPPFEQGVEYYQEFWKIYLTNQLMILRMREVGSLNQELTTNLQTLQKLMEELPPKPKKKRRVSSQIEKKFRCPYHGCQKSYGCDVSMNLHIKLKHNGGNKTEREGMARMICEFEIAGRPCPEVKIKFPPGYLEKFRANFLAQRGR